MQPFQSDLVVLLSGTTAKEAPFYMLRLWKLRADLMGDDNECGGREGSITEIRH